MILNPATTVNTISFDTQYKQVTVICSQKFSPATSYTLTLSGITYCNGISVPTSRLTFETAFPPPAVPVRIDTSKIVITEIFADPSPEVGLPLVEFVELYNPGKDTIDLDGWTLNDPGTKATIRKSKILPDEYVILCPAADTLQYKAFGKTAGISPWPLLNNSSDQVVLKSFKNRVVDSISYSDSWYKDALKKQGGWSLERIDPASLCRGLFNWSAGTDLSGGTPGKQNSLFNPGYNKLVLKADSLRQLSDSTLTISFNKPVDSSIINAAKLFLSPATEIDTISFDISYKRLFVAFDSKFKPETLYTLTISGVNDCSGVSVPSNQLTFETASLPLPPPPLPVRADTAKIFITEIFADPSPDVELPLVEFVELYNPGKDTVDLDGWSLNDPGTTTTIRRSKILPGEYVILCPVADTIQYKTFGNAIGISPWPSLNNSSDQIVLKSFRGRAVDSISYSDLWYKDLTKKQGGWSLERIDPGSLCQGLLNWSASIDPSGGTPGKQNSIFYPHYDKLILKADSVRQLSDSTMRIFFNKPVNESVIDASKLQLSPDAGIHAITFDSQYRQVMVACNQKLSAATPYTLTISQLVECSGTILPDYKFIFQTEAPPPAAVPPPLRIDTGKVFITEIFADPSPEIGLPLAEFVELYNPGRDTIDLNGWTLNDPETKATIKNSKILPDGYIIICQAADTLRYAAFGKTAGISPWPSLNNAADQIILKSFKNRTVDSVSYRDTWYKDVIKKPGGWSLELIDIHTVCSGSQNWIASMNNSGGTPGKQNSVYELYATNDPLKLISVVLTDSITLKLNFNRPADSTSASISYNYSLNNGAGNPVSVLSGPDYDQVILKFGSSIARGNNYQLTVTNLTDCAGISISATGNTAEFIYPEKIAKNDIIINEILFNPRQGGADFVEIYNRSDKLLDLKDLFLATVNNKDSLISLKQLSQAQLLMKPHTYLALSTDPDNIKKEYSPVSTAAFLQLPSFPAFNDDAGIAVLVSGNTRIDQLNYSAKMHFALIKDPEGVSLERSSFNRPANEIGNFYSASASSGYATPGYQNSEYAEDVIPSEEVSLLSKTFSPDNDGFEDLLILNYHLTKPGCIANAIVYDTKGVALRKLARNQTLSEQGTIVWDGLTENNEICPVGIYIVYLEIFNLDGIVRKYRKNCVLAAKLN